ncbi:MAG: DnaD domain protein [Bacillota bacterium]
MANISFSKKKKIVITKSEENQSLEIGKNAVDSGLLKKIPADSLSLYIYILTHLDENEQLKINLNNIKSFLPLSIAQINNSLDKLKNNDIISVEKISKLNKKITVNTNFLNNNEKKDDIFIHRKSFNNYKEKFNYREKIIKKDKVSLSELKKAIVTFLDDDIDYRQYNDEINNWLKDFSRELLQELIRRVNKWLKKQKGNRNQDKAFYYLRGIVDDWYKKEIYNLDKLKYFDRLYRETKDLAKIYGIKWKEINPTQLETLKSWLVDDFALSSSLVEYAIKAAVKRKRDGQPSLKYIEDNFIKKLKENKIRSVREAQRYFNKNKYKKTNNKKDKEKKGNEKKDKVKSWDNFYWDL